MSGGGGVTEQPYEVVAPVARGAAVPFQQRAFADFVGLIARLFYDDAAVALLDFLVREKKAMTEADMREKLRWKEQLLHRKLYSLERQLIVKSEHRFDRGMKSPIFWRINPHIVYAVEWHYEQVLKHLAEQVTQANCLREFECTICQVELSALEAATGKRALEDEHPLCPQCDEKLSISKSKEAKTEVLSKQQRAISQLGVLREALDRLRPMEIAVYPAFTRADKNDQKRVEEKKQKKEEDTPPPPDASISITARDSEASSAASRVIPWFQTPAHPAASSSSRSDVITSGRTSQGDLPSAPSQFGRQPKVSFSPNAPALPGKRPFTRTASDVGARRPAADGGLLDFNALAGLPKSRPRP